MDSTEKALDRTAAAIVCYLTDHSRVREVNGKRSLQILKDGRWVTVFTPGPIRLPEGFSTVRSA